MVEIATRFLKNQMLIGLAPKTTMARLANHAAARLPEVSHGVPAPLRYGQGVLMVVLGLNPISVWL